MTTKKTVQLIIIGNEILSGRTADKNAQQIGRFFTQRGMSVNSILVIPDTYEAFSSAIQKHREVDYVITTGGLGPTRDDLTKTALARHFNLDLLPSDEAFQVAAANHKRFGREFNPALNFYHHFPKGARPINNPKGLAPGLSIENIYCLPGVPHEALAMLEEIPFESSSYERLTLKTKGVPEEKIFGEIDPQLWDRLSAFGDMASYPHLIGVDLVLTLHDPAKKAQALEVAKASPLWPYVYSTDEKTLEQLIIELGHPIGLVESCTGGLTAHRLTNISGSSQVFWGSLVTYANEAKEQLVDVDPEIIKRYGAVSAECAKAMAEGLLHQTPQLTAVLSLTGIAGPTGATHHKPVGLLYLAVALKDQTIVERYEFKNGSRERHKERFSEAGLYHLYSALSKLAIRN